MSNIDHKPKSALVLPGGGARGAFQVGVLKAIAELVPRGKPNPFAVISGSSAGAVNTVVLAAKARRFKIAVAELLGVWSNFRCDQVYRTDRRTMLKSSLHWFAAIVTGGMIGMPKSLLDNSPLRALLSRNVRFPQIQIALEAGWLEAVAITAAGYSSAQSHTFFQATDGHLPWARTRRIGEQENLNLDHVMASIAVPMVFSPVLIGNEYFGDGAMRQATPLSPAIHLGADRILVIGVRNEVTDEESPHGEVPPFPSFAQIAGYTLDALFLDGLYSDLERMTRINQLIDAVPAEHRQGVVSEMRAIDTMVVVPSKDLREIANRHRKELPFAMRALLYGIGGRNKAENRLVSYLLFERTFTRELIDLGYRDAMKVRDELAAFINGDPIPRLFAPAWVKHDLLDVDPT
ncbi:MAG TPA: patatin-like phospholipase family protein [Woeseiaceae bacterium]|nr:patatin-like phospholipase family protein [Woeseiaceae bacterium]